MKLRYLATLPMLALSTAAVAAEPASLADAVAQSTVKLDARLRYENVSQDNALKDADALTLRTRLTMETAAYQGFSALIEFEDSRDAFGVNDYNDKIGNKPEYSVIADPNTTELDQAFLRYQRGMFKGTLGRQVVTLDNHRFVGHVGWRQDRQTFDGVNLLLTPAKDLTLNYVYINQRNRIFAEEKDVDSQDHLVNIGYNTAFGKLSAYAYLLEVDNNTDNGLDTYGVRFAGGTKLGELPVKYQLEYATQEDDASGYEADYYLIEGAATFAGLTAKLGYEVLGSDSGEYGFSTPLATLHKFNGWADQFLTTPKEGLVDLYGGVSGKALGGKFAVIYHDFTADEGTSADDFGSEIDLSYTTKVAKNYTLGVKYAMYDAGDIKVDTDKLWLWASASF
ncbi:alginate export family protein [Ferrimonas sp. SCSIO 43195]|uniref:alginate export family protein n=1 Tax=Ferrimonas sp. SCSIO 43195 TaxID=2822844 RepID=UPI0020761B03|nr:alginate export family protein [Ferrimonas sp. SCSIO 43195]